MARTASRSRGRGCRGVTAPSTGPGSASTTSWSTSSSTPGSSRTPRCITGISPRRCRTRAAGRSAAPPRGLPDYAALRRPAPRRPSGTMGHAQRALVRGVPRTCFGGPRTRSERRSGRHRRPHHLLLAHGLAVDAMRAARPSLDIGLVLNPAPVIGLDGVSDDTVRRVDGLRNRWFQDPVLTGAYPEDVLDDVAGVLDDPIEPGDLETISAPLEWLGVNYYHDLLLEPPVEPEPWPYPFAPPARLAAHTELVTDLRWPVARRSRRPASAPARHLSRTAAAGRHRERRRVHGPADRRPGRRRPPDHVPDRAPEGTGVGHGGRRRCVRLLRVVRLRQHGVARRLRPSLRRHPRRLRHDGPYPEGQRVVATRGHRRQPPSR